MRKLEKIKLFVVLIVGLKPIGLNLRCIGKIVQIIGFVPIVVNKCMQALKGVVKSIAVLHAGLWLIGKGLIMSFKEKLRTMPKGQLEAIYNNCWRNQHNDIDVEKNRAVMRAVELECLLRAIEITGSGGSFEFKGMF